MPNSSCQVCGSQHRIWNCPEFCQKTVPEVGMSLKDFNCAFGAWVTDIAENRAKEAGRVV